MFLPIVYLFLALPGAVQHAYAVSAPRAFAAEVLRTQEATSLTEAVQETLAAKWDPLTDFANSVQNGIDEVAKVAEGAVAAAEIAVLKPMLGDSLVNSLELKDQNIKRLNFQILGVLGFLLVAAFLGFCVDFLKKGPRPNNAPSYLTIAVLLSSYALLVPGLFSLLFRFQIGVEGMGIKVLLSSEGDGKPSELAESTVSTVRLLFKTGGYLGASLLILYAIVVPVVKLMLLSVAEGRRHSTDPEKVRSARNYIHFVQLISKWACPDMFAYILLMYLFRHLDGQTEGPATLRLPSELGIGFACFSLFCVCSTFAVVAWDAPDDPQEEEKTHSPPWGARLVSLPSLHVVTAVLMGLFIGLFASGMLLPCMGMRLNSGLLIEPSGPLPLAAKPYIDELHIEDLVNADVSFMRSLISLCQYTSNGELTTVFAVIMIVVFVMLFPVLDMCVLMWTAWKMSEQPPDVQAALQSLKAARWLKHGCMLDVAVMGVIVVAFAGTAYRKQGVVILMMPGLAVLLAAEVVHYVAYNLVHDSVKWRAKSEN